MSTELIDKLAAALQHMRVCGDCAMDSWNACEGGREAIEALDQYDKHCATPAGDEGVTVPRKAFETVCCALGHIRVGVDNPKGFAADALRQAAEIEAALNTRRSAKGA